MVVPAAERESDVPVRELTHHTSQVLAGVKAGETLTITERASRLPGWCRWFGLTADGLRLATRPVQILPGRLGRPRS